MKADSKSLAAFFRDQGVYLVIARVIGAIFWAIGQPINPFTVLVYSLCIGNFLSSPLRWLHFLYDQPPPLWLAHLSGSAVHLDAARVLAVERHRVVVGAACSAALQAPGRDRLEDAGIDHRALRRHEFSLRQDQGDA